MLPYLEMVFADVMKLRILRGDHSGLSVWARNPKTSVLRGGSKEDTDRRRQCDQGRRGWSDAATIPGMLAATRGGEGELSPGTAAGSRALEFGLLASRHFVALSHQLMTACDSSHRKLFSLKALESRAVMMFCLVAAVFWVDPSSCVMHEPLASVSPGSLIEMQTARLSPDLLNQHPCCTRSPSGSYTCSPLTSASRENSEVTIRSSLHLPESYFLRVKSVERGREVM